LVTGNAQIEVALPPKPARRAAALGGSTWVGLVLDFAQHRTLGAAGGVVVILMLLTAALAVVFAPHDPYETCFL